MLSLVPEVYRQIVGHCLTCVPEEACCLLAGPSSAQEAVVCYPTRNAEQSARTYTVDSLEYLRADRDAEARGLQMIGVFHSHTHTDAYPSATDVAKAPDPAWHYVVVSLRTGIPAARSFRIEDGAVREEPLVVPDL